MGRCEARRLGRLLVGITSLFARLSDQSLTGELGTMTKRHREYSALSYRNLIPRAVELVRLESTSYSAG
jgi:hypothetical protein